MCVYLGCRYSWVNNESENTRVWFDDVTVTQTQATDYDVWGDVLREQKSDASTYRFGYQGQFSEKDLETGWNHFELREYDPVIGRWLSTDPAGQFHSPYVGMGNNPVSGTDPDGSVFEPVYNSEGEYRGNTKEGFTGPAIIYDGDMEFSKLSASELRSQGGKRSVLNAHTAFDEAGAGNTIRGARVLDPTL